MFLKNKNKSEQGLYGRKKQLN